MQELPRDRSGLERADAKMSYTMRKPVPLTRLGLSRILWLRSSVQKRPEAGYLENPM